MYYYICYRGYNWNPRTCCVLFSSIYDDYELGNHVSPLGCADCGGLTIINKVSRDFVKQAVERGVKIFSDVLVFAEKAARGIID